MRDDQIVRIVAAVVILLGYAVRTVSLGNGSIATFGFEASPFAVFVLAETTIALPEILDRVPYGKSR